MDKIGFTRDKRLIDYFLKKIDGMLVPVPYCKWFQVKLKDSQAAPVAQTRQIEYQTTAISHKDAHRTETGIKSVDPSMVIALDEDDFDRF